MQSLEALRQEKWEWEQLLKSPGWKRLSGLLEQQCRLRRLTVFSLDIDGLDKSFQVAKLQGEVAGLQFVMRLAEILMADLDTAIQAALVEEREKTDGNEPE